MMSSINIMECYKRDLRKLIAIQKEKSMQLKIQHEKVTNNIKTLTQQITKQKVMSEYLKRSEIPKKQQKAKKICEFSKKVKDYFARVFGSADTLSNNYDYVESKNAKKIKKIINKLESNYSYKALQKRKAIVKKRKLNNFNLKKLAYKRIDDLRSRKKISGQKNANEMKKLKFTQDEVKQELNNLDKEFGKMRDSVAILKLKRKKMKAKQSPLKDFRRSRFLDDLFPFDLDNISIMSNGSSSSFTLDSDSSDVESEY